MGIETSQDHDGSGCSFTSAIIAVEELAKVDASVAVLCDVHNTLVNTVLRIYGSEEIKQKWLPGLATDTVTNIVCGLVARLTSLRSDRSACPSRMLDQTRLDSRLRQRRMATTTLSTGAKRESRWARRPLTFPAGSQTLAKPILSSWVSDDPASGSH